MSKRSTKVADPFYSSQAWETIRLKAIRRDAWRCVQCGCLCRGRRHGEPSPHVDHILERKDRPDLALVLSNLQLLCARHHSQKTRAHEQDKPRIGLDGYPVE